MSVPAVSTRDGIAEPRSVPEMRRGYSTSEELFDPWVRKRVFSRDAVRRGCGQHRPHLVAPYAREYRTWRSTRVGR
eukprot:1844450-Rhodomonas_salina.1